MSSPDRKSEIGQNPVLEGSFLEPRERGRKRFSVPQVKSLARGVGAILVCAGLATISLLPDFQVNTAQADTLQRPPNPYTFTIDSNHQGKIAIRHGEFALPGSPNPPGMAIDDLDLYINDVLILTTQPNSTLHPALNQPWAVNLAVEGVLVDGPKKLVLIATSTGCNGRGLVCADGVEEAPFDDLGNYNARTMTGPEGTPQTGSMGDATSAFEFRKDGLGNSAMRTFINLTSGNGSYRKNRDATTGKLIDKWWRPNFSFLPTVSNLAQAH